MIAAGSSSPLDRVRAKLEEAFGAVRPRPDPDAAGRRRGGSRRDAHPRDRPQAARRARVPETGVDGGRDADDRALRDRAAPAQLVRPHLGRRPRRPAELPARSDPQGEAPAPEGSSRARASTARSSTTRRPPDLVLAGVSRWEVEKGARPLVDGSALSERAVGSTDWVVGEVLSFRGDGVVEPLSCGRKCMRARELEREIREARAG